MKIIKVDVNNLILADYNPRVKLKPGDRAYEELKRSIQKFGYVDLIICNKDLKVIAGHQRIPVLKELGYKVVDVVQVDIGEYDEKALNIALNKIDGSWDFEKLESLLDDIKINSPELFNFTGFDDAEFEKVIKEFETSNNNNSSNGGENTSTEGADKETVDQIKSYTEKIKAPIYEPKMENPPDLKDCINIDKCMKLIEKIKSKNFDKDLESFLIFSAYRFIVFHYENIAELYCHQDKNIQEVMEELALIIIDLNKAIEHGLTEFADSIYKNNLKNEGEEIVTE
ncbi:MAG: hypothetical protein PHF86_12285 [Candidatus Nanoarchaeia archaeon]|nr:hypothetical protein [Candidatus Nanoarchaeia archaeon]